jgi:hypothetical protein
MSEVRIPDRNRPKAVLYLVSYLQKTVPDFWGILVDARVIYERAVITLTDEIFPFDTVFGPRHAGVYVDEKGRRYYEHPGFEGLPSWHMFDRPKDFPLAEWKDELYPGLRYVRNGEPVLAETLNGEAAALLGTLLPS